MSETTQALTDEQLWNRTRSLDGVTVEHMFAGRCEDTVLKRNGQTLATRTVTLKRGKPVSTHYSFLGV